jgi:hypothetical protein
MIKQVHTLNQIFVNEQRKTAAKWIYKLVSIAQPESTSNLASSVVKYVGIRHVNDLAAEGWEPYLMSDNVILLRRDATGAFDEDESRERANKLKAVETNSNAACEATPALES